MLLTAFAMLCGAGGAPRAAIAMGQKNHDMAEKIVANCFSLLLCFAVIALGLKYVSLASVMCMLIYPLIMYQTEMIILNNVLDTSSPIFGSIVRDVGLSFLIAFMMAILVIFMHRENIKRLLRGKESKLDLKGKKKTLYEESKAEKSNESDEK